METAENGIVQRQNATVAPGSADILHSYYFVQGLTPGVTYVVTMANPTADADMTLYQGDPTFSQNADSRTLTGPTTESLKVTANPDVTSFFISVDGSNTNEGAKFDLSVIVEPKSEGTITSPVYIGSLFDGAISRPGSTVAFNENCCEFQAEGDSYYLVSITGQALISITEMTNDVDLYVFSATDPDDADGGFDVPECESTKLGTAIATCATIFSIDYYIAVTGANAELGAAFRINVIPMPRGTENCDDLNTDILTDQLCYLGDVPVIMDLDNSQGRTSVFGGGAPGIIPLNPMDYSTPVSPDSYYEVSVTHGQRYRVALENATDRVGLYVFDRDSSFTTPMPACPLPNPQAKIQECTIEATGNSIFFAVDGSESEAGAAYTISVLPEFLAEGTLAAPKPLTVAEATASLDNIRTVLKDEDIGIVGGSDSYYKITGLVAGDQYLLSIPGMSDDVDLYVFDDATYKDVICTPYMGGTAPEQCPVTAIDEGGDGVLYFAVDGSFTKAGAAFLVQVLSGSGSGEGTDTVPGDDPKVLGAAPVGYVGYAIGTFTEDSTVDSADSFYKVSVQDGKFYDISITGLTDDVDVFVYTTSADVGLLPGDTYTGNHCEDAQFGTADEGCRITADGGTLYVWIESSFSIAGTPVNFELSVREFVPPTPEELVLADFPRVGEEIEWASGNGIGSTKDRYYKVTDLINGVDYRVTMSNLTDDVDLYVFGVDSTFSSPESCENTYNYGTTTEYCTFTADASGELYFAVDGYWISGDEATYRITVEVAP